MIIPVKCFTCGEVLADKYRYYLEQVKSKKMKRGIQSETIAYLTHENTSKTPEGEVLDELKLKKPCCRTQMLTHVAID